MPIARLLISTASFEPDELRMLGEVFDQVWAIVALDFGADPDEIEAARMRLATIILDLAKDGQLGSHQISGTATRLIRQFATQGKVNG